MEISRMTFSLLFNDIKFSKGHYFAVMVTGMDFYDLNYLISTKSRLSNQKSGKMPEVILIQN